jgi:hypothetical protein
MTIPTVVNVLPDLAVCVWEQQQRWPSVKAELAVLHCLRPAAGLQHNILNLYCISCSRMTFTDLHSIGMC